MVAQQTQAAYPVVLGEVEQQGRGPPAWFLIDISPTVRQDPDAPVKVTWFMRQYVPIAEQRSERPQSPEAFAGNQAKVRDRP